jgi:hypothetical protein
MLGQTCVPLQEAETDLNNTQRSLRRLRHRDGFRHFVRQRALDLVEIVL